MLKKLAIVPLLALGLTACDSSDEVGDVGLGWFTMKDIKLNTWVDPVVTVVTCHVASIEADLSLSDPSDSSISCRQTGDITPEMIAQIDKSKSGEVVFKKPKRSFFRTLRFRRIFNPITQPLLYFSI